MYPNVNNTIDLNNISPNKSDNVYGPVLDTNTGTPLPTNDTVYRDV